MNHQGHYKVKNVNTRIQKAGDEDGPLAVDIHITNTVHRGALLEIFDAHQIDALIGGLFDEDGKALNVGVEHIHLDNDFQGTVRIGLGLQNWAVISDAAVNKFRLSPNGAGTFDLQCRIQGEPSEGDLEDLCRLQKGSTDVQFDVTPFVQGREPEDESQGQMPLDEAA